MDQSRIAGKWKQLTGRVKEQWGAITEDDVRESDGHLDVLAGKIQERTGEARDKVRAKLRDLEASL